MAAIDGSDSLITAEDAINYIVKDGLVARIAANRYQASGVELEAARQSLLPTAQAALSADRRRSFAASENSISATARVSGMYEISLAHVKTYQAQRGECAADLKVVQQQRDDAAVGVLLYYINVVNAGKLIAAAADNRDYEELKLDEVETLSRQGVKAHSDVLQQRTAAAEAESNLLSARTVHERARNALTDVLGLPISGAYRFDSSAIVMLSAGLFVDSLRQWRMLVREREEIVAARYRVAAAEMTFKARQLMYIPSISLSGGWSGNRQRLFVGNGEAGQSDPSNSISAGASVGMPLFDQRQRNLQVQRAKNNLQEQQLELERMEREISVAVMQAALDDTMAQLQVKVAQTRCLAATEALQAMEERYRMGASTISEYNSVRSGYTDALNAAIDTRFNSLSSRIKLLHSIGRADLIVAAARSRPMETR